MIKISAFKELVKSFPKTREYIRDFFVYGFKTREEFKYKSPRTYDNERRRLESWLSPYIRKDHVSNGSNISLAIDSNLLDTNPLFQVWKTKSFTDNDIVLHFLILDLLQNERPFTAEEITDSLLTKYSSLFDTQIVRRKCNAFEKEGLLHKKKIGKTVVFFIDNTLAVWTKSNKAMQDALAFYQMTGNFGIIGNNLLEQFDCHNQSFRVKHSFFVHTLEDELLLKILNIMNNKTGAELEIKSPKTGKTDIITCIPLQIFTSTRSGRRFLCGYVNSTKRFTCFRLDSIKKAIPVEIKNNYNKPDYNELQKKLDKNRQKVWGVSFQGSKNHHTEKLSMTIYIIEPTENYIIERLKREGRGGTITKKEQNIYKYETEVFDCNEMLPWIRTFIGRIISLECSAKSVEQRFYHDLQEMCQIYQIGEGR